MPLRAIAYVSKVRPDLSAERLHVLVEDAARFNKLAGVTGVLLHDGDRFLQYIEGPPDGIDSVYERILQAGSHIDIVELARGRLGQRQFPYWSMRALPVEAALLRQLSASDWSGFTRALQGDRSAPTPVDLLDRVVQPVLHVG
ncbi:BLUF domain-containing protein [Stenotrophomonas maltophilia]|uniref:BLUF domain-containing protein n=1 Tax=Stenotrophomonas maltophilia TaxID=40324 RepID=UPI000C25E52C|nr:BLUF domain-containing protein [Stenotrophomonas maltophilia]PJL44922.1 F420H(2):quinone oxidoreductase [Stenotrophomonas maltophilia]